LTLSRVIAALGQPGSTHINFRDSKLTRILKPSLSGNARMAVICCATPSELYIEETRSTLQFALRAKLVKMKPQVNKVIDDSSLIKRLQRELAEARKLAEGRENQQQSQHLQAEAQDAAKEAEARLHRLKAYFLKGPILPSALFGEYSRRENDGKTRNEVFEGEKDKRRWSYGPAAMQMTPENFKIRTIQAFQTCYVGENIASSAEAKLLKDALHAKGGKLSILLAENSALHKEINELKAAKDSILGENGKLDDSNSQLKYQLKCVKEENERLKCQLKELKSASSVNNIIDLTGVDASDGKSIVREKVH
jgi:hypothetical protein